MVAGARMSHLRVLLYHRIQDPSAVPPDLCPDLVSASPEALEHQLQHLVRFYHPIGADELLAALDGHHFLPEGAVLLTFDDGYRDFLDLAWPVLKRYHVAASLFVPTVFVDNTERTFWWDTLWQVVSRTRRRSVVLPGTQMSVPLPQHDRLEPWRTVAEWLKRLSPQGRAVALDQLIDELGVTHRSTRALLSWPELRQLADDGVTVASHSQTHELLDQLDTAALRREVAGSRDDLVRGLGSSRPLFAYPNGNFNAEAVHALRMAGFQAAFTTVHGVNMLGKANPLLLRRDQTGVSFLRFASHLFGPVAKFRAYRHKVALAN